MPAATNNIKAFKWVLITAIGFVLFLGLAVVFSLYSSKLNLINSSTYFFLLVPMALLAAGFLFGALRSHAKYQGKAYNGTVELSGPVVVLALIIIMGYKFRPSESSFGATINVFSADSSHASVREGMLSVYYGSAHISKSISDGQVVLSEVPKEFRGREVTIIPSAEGFSQQAIKLVLPANENVLNLYIEHVPDSVTVSGIVITEKGKPVTDAVVVFADGIGKTTTNEFGNFRLTLPFKDGKETNVRVYKNGSMKYNNLMRLTSQGALTLQLQ